MPFAGKGVVLVDLNGCIRYGSTYFCDLVGVQHSELGGMSCFDFVFPEDLGAAKELLEENKLPNPAPFLFRLRRTDGAGVWVDIQGAPLKTADGQLYAVSATVTLRSEKSN